MENKKTEKCNRKIQNLKNNCPKGRKVKSEKQLNNDKNKTKDVGVFQLIRTLSPTNLEKAVSIKNKLDFAHRRTSSATIIQPSFTKKIDLYDSQHDSCKASTCISLDEETENVQVIDFTKEIFSKTESHNIFNEFFNDIADKENRSEKLSFLPSPMSDQIEWLYQKWQYNNENLNKNLTSCPKAKQILREKILM
ncbi:unnamed protein product [Blepharisma stoltei]|uniref:Uncharacterized protein n=1 Tax=Blepharisma stoltei TaxID=1481888 RepID=A0AAU9ISM6_9CILI|nr:unnamed protein product [Blepharisma stoltei]